MCYIHTQIDCSDEEVVTPCICMHACMYICGTYTHVDRSHRGGSHTMFVCMYVYMYMIYIHIETVAKEEVVAKYLYACMYVCMYIRV